MELEGVIQKDGSVVTDDGKSYNLPVRGTDEDGFPEVLIDATDIGGRGYMTRQSIKPYVGMTVSFFCNTKPPYGYNYKILEKIEKEVRNNDRNNYNNRK